MKNNKGEFQVSPSLKHILFIIDGNGRWAKKRLMPRTYGHAKGVSRLKEIIEECFLTYNIPYVSAYCFSTENWNRPENEVKTLFRLLKEFFENNISRFIEMNAKIKVIGFLNDERIPKDVLDSIYKAMEMTKNCNKYCFCVLFNYGGKQDIVNACKNIVKENRDIDSLNINNFKDYLLTKGIPDVDLLVRTSGEMRISNCYLYQTAYAEFEFPKTYWPDFNKKSLRLALEEYNSRDRRFGAIKK